MLGQLQAPSLRGLNMERDPVRQFECEQDTVARDGRVSLQGMQRRRREKKCPVWKKREGSIERGEKHCLEDKGDPFIQQLF